MAVVLLTVLAAAVWWLCASPLRIAVTGAALVAAHPVQTMVLTVAAVAALVTVAALIVYRSLAESGGLVSITRPAAGGGTA